MEEITKNRQKIDSLEKKVVEQEIDILVLERKVQRQDILIRTQEEANNQQREQIKDHEDMFTLFSNL